MSLATCCPACGTLFRVVPDQLKISDGWVRCGRCGEVFDAAEHMRTGADAQAPGAAGPQNAAAPQSAPAPAASVDFEIDIAPVSAETLLVRASEPAGSSTAPAVPDPSAWPEGDGIGPESAPAETPVPAAAVEASPAASSPSLQDQEPQEPEEDQEPQAPEEDQEPQAPQEPHEPDEALEAVLADAAPSHDPFFVRQARRRAFWRRGGVRAVLALVALLLLMLLLGQVALFHRDGLAAWQPALRPALEQLCRPLDCRVGLPRRIESIVIDSSAFARLGPGTYRLALTLRNASATPVALPALELTLTDVQDQPVLRRVLTAAELGPQAPAVMAAGAEWSATLTLGVDASAGDSRIAGYRLLAFYP